MRQVIGAAASIQLFQFRYTLCGGVSIHFVWMRGQELELCTVKSVVWSVNSAVWSYDTCCTVNSVRIAKSGRCHCHWPQVKIATIDGLVSPSALLPPPRIIIIRIQYFPPHFSFHKSFEDFWCLGFPLLRCYQTQSETHFFRWTCPKSFEGS